jgi:hypothetical protein
VAMPAWSQPGTKRTVLPHIRCLQVLCKWLILAITKANHLAIVSWTVVASAWPKWRVPVTFGGGMTIVNWPFGFCSLKLDLWDQASTLTSYNSLKVSSTEFRSKKALSFPPFVPSRFNKARRICRWDCDGHV